MVVVCVKKWRIVEWDEIEGQRWFDLHYVFWCKIRTSISTPFPPLHYLILFVCNGPSIGLPDSFYMQWTLH
jgi:hypothetical protein